MIVVWKQIGRRQYNQQIGQDVSLKLLIHQDIEWHRRIGFINDILNITM